MAHMKIKERGSRLEFFMAVNN